MTSAILAIDLFCGLGGWADGFLAEGYDVIGFDIERHDYGTGGYPGQLVIQDVTTLDGAQFKDAAVIVASPPCQEFSYMAMPWSRARQIAGALQGEISLDGLMVPFPEGYEGSRTTAELTRLFDACFRIQREACEAAGRYIPLVVENVKGAQKWVGRAQANFGSYYLWGDVGMVGRRVIAGPLQVGNGVAPIKAHKVPGFRFDGNGGSFQTASVARHATKNEGGSWWAISHNRVSHSRGDAIKGFTPNGERMGKNKGPRLHGSKSSARKAASAMIAKIPFALSRFIAQQYAPAERLSCPTTS